MRAVALYRASTKGQTDKETNDIPSQKKIVREFIDQKGWTLVREFTEAGVSGFKVSANNRDSLQIIKDMASQKEFDVLVVYMSDRLGRRSDESPFIVSWLKKQNVIVWSYSEGELKSETHTDGLINFIRFWQSEGESLKTRQRVTDYHIEAVQNGRFRGGSFIPYGYKLIDNGSKNFKGRHVLDFMIDEEEAEIVKLIYKLSIENNYGQTKIAKTLNSKKIKNKDKDVWYGSTIQYILGNPIYKGIFHIKSKMYGKTVMSDVIEELIIIPENVWEINQIMMKKRTRKEDSVKDGDERLKISETLYVQKNKATFGVLLFSGKIYCGTCGCPLTTMTAYKRWETKDGVKHRVPYHKYRCSSYYRKTDNFCKGQHTYSAEKIETEIVNEIKYIIGKIAKEKIDENYIIELDSQISSFTKRKNNLQSSFKKLEEQIAKLKSEVVLSLMGESHFSPELLNEQILIKEKEVQDNNKIIKDLTLEIAGLNESRESYLELGFNLENWVEEFDKLDYENKKIKISSVVKQIVIYEDEVKITFQLSVKKFEEKIGCQTAQHVRVHSVYIHPILLSYNFRF